MPELTLAQNNNAVSQDFIKDFFGPVTEHPVWLQSLGNPGSDETSRHITTRDLTDIAGFATKWDRPGRGMYFCVSTITGTARTKETVAEIPGLHADIDFKDTDDIPADVLRKIKALRCPPSRIHATGNGYHCFWLFKEAMAVQTDMERIEAALKLVCDLVGGDQAVTQAAALMRLPGTHNTKFGEWAPVVIVDQNERRYELDDLEDWLSEQSPVILRKVRPAIVTADTNPFSAHAKEHGFRPSIDVGERLAAMSYMAGGDAAVHKTQLAVSASLLTGGTSTDDAVKLILEATKGAATGYGERWNWKREEGSIRKMCSDWLRKHPLKLPTDNKPAVRRTDQISESGQVVALAPRRAAKVAGGGTSHHVILGGAILAEMRARGEDILVTDGEVWRYHDRLWSEPINEASWLNGVIEVGTRALEFPSTIKLRNETRQWLLCHPDVMQNGVLWDNHGMIPTRSGLLNIATMTLEAARPEHLATWRIDCDYDPAASCPWWLVMLDDFFGDRPPELRAATISTLQEVLGAALMEVKARGLTRALILEGPSEAGKTRVLDVLCGLICDRPVSTPLEALGGTHGLMEFRRRAPWVLHEAFAAGVWHMSSIVKSILTGDPVQINVKNGPLTTQRIKSPVFWGTNHPPQFKEATKAIVNRLIVIKCRVVFDPKDLIGAAAEARKRGFAEPSELILKDEMPGLLNWAIAGAQRAVARGYIEKTAEMEETMERVRTDSNMVAGFLEECCEYGSDIMIAVPDFCASFAVWWCEYKGEERRPPSNESIGRAMTALGDARIVTESKDFRDNTRRYYGGINLNGVGLDYWDGAHSEGLAKGKTARTSTSRGEVNRCIPDKWKARPAVARLMKFVTVQTVTDGASSKTVSSEGDSSPCF
jgi:phage/plasmid-associated DNA primase